MEKGTRVLQTQDPVQQLAVYLVGFHASEDGPSHQMTAHHFYLPINQNLTQCALFDGNSAEANLTGVELHYFKEVVQRPSARRATILASAQLRNSFQNSHGTRLTGCGRTRSL